MVGDDTAYLDLVPLKGAVRGGSLSYRSCRWVGWFKEEEEALLRRWLGVVSCGVWRGKQKRSQQVVMAMVAAFKELGLT